MPLYYKARQSVLKSKDGKKKWFPQLIKAKTPITTDDLSAQLAKRSSLSAGDVKNVFDNLPDVLSMFLMNSQSVKIKGLGTFTAIASARGAGVDTEEEVSSKQIKGLKIRFTPSYTRNPIEGTTRTMYSNIVFEKYDAVKSKLGEVEPDPEEGGNNGGIDPDA